MKPSSRRREKEHFGIENAERESDANTDPRWSWQRVIGQRKVPSRGCEVYFTLLFETCSLKLRSNAIPASGDRAGKFYLLLMFGPLVNSCLDSASNVTKFVEDAITKNFAKGEKTNKRTHRIVLRQATSTRAKRVAATRLL